MHGALVIEWGWKAKTGRIPGEMDIPALAETGIHIWLIWVGRLRDFLKVRGLLKEQGLHRAYCSGERIGRQNCLGALCPAGWELKRSSHAPSPWLATQPQGPPL